MTSETTCQIFPNDDATYERNNPPANGTVSKESPITMKHERSRELLPAFPSDDGRNFVPMYETATPLKDRVYPFVTSCHVFFPQDYARFDVPTIDITPLFQETTRGGGLS